jgi:signal transduction histidine kinase
VESQVGPSPAEEGIMTLRLVALISVVLLLSLAAFGLLMGYYQDQVVQVVADTASDVGRATLRALELGEREILLEGRTRNVFTWSGPAAVAESMKVSSDVEHVAGVEHGRVFVTEAGDPDEARQRFRTVERIVRTSPDGGETVAVRGRVSGEFTPPGGLQSVAGGREELARCLESDGVFASGDHGAFFIDVEKLHVESDVTGGLVLKIATWTPTEEGRPEQEVSVEFHPADLPHPSASADLLLAKDEIHLPIELAHYRELSEKVRSRSLALFVGVFAVGTVLSAGLAARFTRPIRKLDAGIRRLSAGDLDVQVQVQGKDEIGRLSRAFNEMAGKLRANRERGRELVRREKLSALGRLAAGVAHDVRNPLHSIGLTLQHLQETSRPDEDAQASEFDRSVDIIRGEIRRLDQLVGNFLSFAKSERRERERIDLGDLLRETERLVQKEAERRNVVLELDVDGTTPPVSADAESLRSSILNLVLNSFEAMPDGGRLRLELSRQGDSAVVEITDTGQGIPEEHQEHVFDFAYTTREGGTGLGLAMVHHCVVEEHGGQVSLDSKPGQGTRVRMALPVQPGGNGGTAS